MAWSAARPRLGQLFGRKDAQDQAMVYLDGLLGAVERKNGWQLAECVGDARPLTSAQGPFDRAKSSKPIGEEECS